MAAPRLTRVIVLILGVCLALLSRVGVGQVSVVLEEAPPQTAAIDSPVAIGPYVQNVGCERATVCWATVEGEATIAGPDGAATLPRYKVHELVMSNLKPNTTYQYDVLGTGSDSGKGSFTTFPDRAEPFRFVVVGDTRSHHDKHKAIVDRMIAEEPLFVVNTGDLVSDGLNIEHWMEFFRINHTLMRSVPYFPVLGNHENDSSFYFDFFSLPQNERYYMFSVGPALFLFIDVEGYDYDTPVYMDDAAKQAWWTHQNLAYMKRQKAWVENMLTLHESAGYLFVFLHEPLISVKRTRVEGAKRQRAFWDGIFEKHRVSVVFAGHDHHYHRAVIDGTHHITTAGGGAGLYDPDTPAPETVIVKKVNHFCRVDVGPQEAKVTAIEINGDIIEHLVLPRRDSRQKVQVVPTEHSKHLPGS
jgi:3',5'-cyclic AMP phosphodiesterase CpdA